MRRRPTRIAMAAELQAPKDFLPEESRRLLPSLTATVVQSVETHVQEHQLGYYPALDYFRAQTDVDIDAVNALIQAARLAQEYVQALVLRRLSAPFSQVYCDHSLPLALTIPRVRPHQPNRLQALAEHYRPDLVRLHLVTRTLERNDCCMASHARARAVRWLSGCCCGQITQSRPL